LSLPGTVFSSLAGFAGSSTLLSVEL
jgi:hypothetical protein